MNFDDLKEAKVLTFDSLADQFFRLSMIRPEGFSSLGWNEAVLGDASERKVLGSERRWHSIWYFEHFAIVVSGEGMSAFLKEGSPTDAFESEFKSYISKMVQSVS